MENVAEKVTIEVKDYASIEEVPTEQVPVDELNIKFTNSDFMLIISAVDGYLRAMGQNLMTARSATLFLKENTEHLSKISALLANLDNQYTAIKTKGPAS